MTSELLPWIKLKDCPFCGAGLEDYYGDGRKAYHPYTNCFLDGDEWWTDEQNFIEAWNRRDGEGK